MDLAHVRKQQENMDRLESSGTEEMVLAANMEEGSHVWILKNIECVYCKIMQRQLWRYQTFSIINNTI